MTISQSDITCERLDQENYYYIGTNKITGEKILSVTITWIVWYEIIFKISNTEYNLWDTDKNALNELAKQMFYDKGLNKFKDRILYNGGPTR